MDALIGRVLLLNCFRLLIPMSHPHKCMLVFEQPETFPKPIPYAGQQSYSYLPREISQRLPPRYPYFFQSLLADPAAVFRGSPGNFPASVDTLAVYVSFNVINRKARV
jgi:hypothetical protein